MAPPGADMKNLRSIMAGVNMLAHSAERLFPNLHSNSFAGGKMK